MCASAVPSAYTSVAWASVAEPLFSVVHTAQLVFRQHQISIRARFEEHKTVPSFKVARDLLQAGQVGVGVATTLGAPVNSTAACNALRSTLSTIAVYAVTG